MAKITTGPTAERVRELLDYDPETGVFRWRAREYVAGQPNQMRSTYAGRVAGNINRTGYRTIHVDGHMHNAQRLAWIHVTGEWPEVHVDHKNGIKDDNRFCNLRLATPAQNQRNRKVSTRSRSGVKGVGFEKQTKKWKASITVNYKFINLGRYDSCEEAAAAYAEAAKRYHGEFART